MPEKYCDNGDLLFAWSTTFGPYIWTGSKAIFHYHIWKVLPHNILDEKFAYYLLTQITDALKAASHGSSMPHITKKSMEDWVVTLPPLDEQHRIVAILQEKMTAINQARAAAQAQLEAAQALPAAYLRQVFNSPEMRGWPKKRLGDVNLLLPAKSVALAGDAEVNVITTACLTETGFNPNGIKPSRMWSHDAAECVVSKGEILIARSNTSELVGRVAMFDGVPTDVVASDLTIRVWPCQEEYYPSFLASYLSSLYLNGYWRNRAGGASQSMKKITRVHVSNIQVPTPDLETQKNIVADLDGKIHKAKQVDGKLQSQLDAINALPAALLRQAFNGEL